MRHGGITDGGHAEGDHGPDEASRPRALLSEPIVTWYAVYEETTGSLRSLTTVAPTGLASGLTAKTLADGPDASRLWDEALLDWRPRPAEVLSDRLQDLVNDPVLSAVWTRLTVAQRQTLRDRLVALLGPRRWRQQAEPVDLEG